MNNFETLNQRPSQIELYQVKAKVKATLKDYEKVLEDPRKTYEDPRKAYEDPRKAYERRVENWRMQYSYGGDDNLPAVHSDSPSTCQKFIEFIGLASLSNLLK